MSDMPLSTFAEELKKEIAESPEEDRVILKQRVQAEFIFEEISREERDYLFRLLDECSRPTIA